jgi:hypothetical protein
MECGLIRYVVSCITPKIGRNAERLYVLVRISRMLIRANTYIRRLKRSVPFVYL